MFEGLLFVLHQPFDLREHLLHQFARLWEPLREETVRVDLHQLTTLEEHAHPKVASKLNLSKPLPPDDKLLSQCSAKAGLSSAWRSMKKNHPMNVKFRRWVKTTPFSPVASNNIGVDSTQGELQHGVSIHQQVPLHWTVIYQALPDTLKQDEWHDDFWHELLA